MTADKYPNLRFRLRYDDQGTDPGDWLPRDQDHYDRVGPFQGNPNDEDDTDTTAYRDLTWEEWSRRYDAKLDNWVSYGMVLVTICPHCDEEKEAGPSIWGLDFLDYQGPGEGTYAYGALPDEWLRSTADELASEHAYEQEQQ